MVNYEYRVLPAPRKGKSGKGLRGSSAKFANAVSVMMNDLGADGWEYIRADTLPCEERQGLTGKTVKYHSMLVFRRPLGEETKISSAPPILPLAAPEPEYDEDLIEDEIAAEAQEDVPEIRFSASRGRDAEDAEIESSSGSDEAEVARRNLAAE